MKNKLFSFAVLLMSLTGSLCAGEVVVQPVEIKPIGRTIINFALDEKTNVQFVIITKATNPAASQDSNAYLHSIGLLFGREDRAETVIDGISVQWGHIPPSILSLSASADLYDASNVVIKKQGSNLILRIRGGDGCCGYTAELEIAPHGVIERRVRQTYGFEETTKYRHTERYMRNFSEMYQARVLETQKLKDNSVKKAPQ